MIAFTGVAKWAFHRLVDELSPDQYERMIVALRQANLPVPGWTDRLSADQGRVRPSEAIRVLAPLETFVRAIALARTARRGHELNDPKRGVWLQASAGQVRVCGSDDYAAAFMEVDATVDVPGTIVVDGRDIWQIAEALRKNLPTAQRAEALVRLESEGDDYVRIGVGNRSHRARLLPRRADTPPLPPRAKTGITLPDGATFRRAVLQVVPAADHDSRKSTSTNFGYVSLRNTEGILTIDARSRYIAAQANLPVDTDVRIALLADYVWLRDLTVAIGPGPVEIGHVSDLGEHGLLMVAGDRWAAWSSETLPWRQRLVPAAIPGSTIVEIRRDDVYRHLTEAKRLSESSWTGKNSTLVKLTVSPDSLIVSSVADPESAHVGNKLVSAQTPQPAEVAEVYFRISTLLSALQGFAKLDVALHFGETGLLYATTTGHRPDERPPFLTAIPIATPAPIGP